MQIRTAIALTAFAAMTAGTANAALVTETFTYADGSSLTDNAAWVDHSGTTGDLLVNSGAAVVQHGTPSEDAHVLFTSFSTGVLTATFDIVVSDDAQIGDGGGTDFEYFAHFFAEGGFSFRSRLSVVAANDTNNGDYALGISSTTSTEQATTAADFSFGATVSVTLNLDLDTGTGSLTVGAETIVGDLGNANESMDSFALRQSDSTNNETVTVDNLVVSHVPEPGSLALLGLGGLALIRRRRSA